jgi:superfamily II RNA helicase
MAGRAGRRGIDTVGHVIHLTNLFRNTDQIAVKTMMKGKPQTLTSKFKISYNLILNLIDIGETDYTRYVKRSMVQGDIENNMKECYMNISKLQSEIDNIQLVLENCRTPIATVEEYINLKHKLPSSVNKKRKEIERNIQLIKDENKTIEKDAEIVSNYNSKITQLNILNDQLISTENTLQSNVHKVINMLLETEFIKQDNNINYLSLKGHIASNLREIHCLIFAQLIESGKLKQFQTKELVGILSCFTNITVPEEKRAILPISNFDNVKNFIINIYDSYQKQSNIELQESIDTGIDYSMHFDLIDYVIRWCDCKNDIECKQLLHDISIEKEIFLGEFVKAILKINNITAEMEKIAENLGDIEFLSILKDVPLLTLKYIATNQSLYV